jgi:RNA polymerase sigma-70 factor (ECF subfamily)
LPTSDTASPRADADLLREAAAGRHEALALLYDRHTPQMLALAVRILGNRAEAEDAVQDAFVYAWRNASRYDPARSSVATWLVLVARSRAIDRLRAARPGEPLDAALSAPELHTSPEAVAAVLNLERAQRVREELARLPEEQIEVLRMAFFGGFTQTEIAAATGIPLGTVKTRTLLAMKKLRMALRTEIRELL